MAALQHQHVFANLNLIEAEAALVGRRTPIVGECADSHTRQTCRHFLIGEIGRFCKLVGLHRRHERPVQRHLIREGHLVGQIFRVFNFNISLEKMQTQFPAIKTQSADQQPTNFSARSSRLRWNSMPKASYRAADGTGRAASKANSLPTGSTTASDATDWIG